MAVADMHAINTAMVSIHTDEHAHLNAKPFAKFDHPHMGNTVSQTQILQNQIFAPTDFNDTFDISESDLDCQHCCHCHSKTPIVIAERQTLAVHIHNNACLLGLTYAPVQGIEFPHLRPPINVFSG